MSKKLLLGAGVAAILAVALAPEALEAWRERERRAEADEQLSVIEAKEREIACLEGIKARLAPGIDVKAEIARCREESRPPEAR